jgi:hypothetical protein
VSIGDYGIDNLKARVDNMCNEWIIFFGHSDWDAASQSKFVELVDYVQGKGIEITTVNTALDIFENTLEVTNDADATKSFVVGADGMVYSSQINNLNGIFAAPHTVNNDTPITSFEKHKTTSVSFTASSSSGITVSNGAGTLIAYRINDDDALNFQVFYPYNDSYTYRRKWSVANSAWLDWTTTVDKVYVDELTNKYRMLGMNIFASTAGIGVFDYGITIYDFNSGGSTGFPATAGTVITYKTPQDPNWCYQKYEGYQSNSCWKRYATGADTWSAWTKISAV